MGLFIFIAIIVLIVYLVKRNKKEQHDESEVLGKTESVKVDNIRPISSRKEQEKFCVVVDIETTGLMKYKDLVPNKSNLDNFPHILEIGWGIFSSKGELICEGNYLIKQKQPIPIKATQKSGITYEECEKNGRELSEVLQKFATDINGGLRIVGHNVMFDKRIIESAFIREGVPTPFKGMTNYDTMKMGKAHCGMEKWPKLVELYEEMTGNSSKEYKKKGIMGDVAMTTQIFFLLKKYGKLHNLRKASTTKE